MQEPGCSLHLYCANYLHLIVCGPVAYPHQQRHRCTGQRRTGGSEKSNVLPNDTQLGLDFKPKSVLLQKTKDNKHGAHFSSAYFTPGPVPGFACTTRVEAGQEMTGAGTVG